MENKKSFLFYVDWGSTFDELSDKDAGKLIKHLCDYVRDKNPKASSILIKAVFANIKNTLKRDLEKWQDKSEKNRENANIRWNKHNANASNRIKGNAKNADRDKVIVKDKDRDNNKEQEFKNSLQQYRDNYTDTMLKEFYMYWTETKPNGKKLRYEMEKTFDISRRLKRWSENNFNNKNKPNEELNEIARQISTENPNL